jgi:hypothetical protein
MPFSCNTFFPSTSESFPARVVVPTGLRQPLLERLHIVHSGTWSTFMTTVRSAFFWPSMQQDITAFLDSCDACKRARTVRVNGAFGNSEQDAALKPTRIGDVYQMDKWHWPLAAGGSLIVHGAIDLYTGFVSLRRVPAHTSAAATAMLRHLHDAYGPMRGVHTDGGPEYKGEFAALAQRLGVQVTHGSPGNSNSQARVERVFRALNDIIVRLLTHSPWATLNPDDVVSAAQIAINSVMSRGVEGAPASSAFARHFGRPPPLSPLMASAVTPISTDESPLEWQFAQLAVAIANDAAGLDAAPTPLTPEQRAARRADLEKRSGQAIQGAHGPPLTVVKNDLVFVHTPTPPMGKVSKLVRGRFGPLRIESILSTGADGKPLKVRLQMLGDHTAPHPPPCLDVFVRNLTKCGPALAIDDPQLRCLPPSGFFVGELADSHSQHAVDRLQAIIDQSTLAPDQIARLRARRAQTPAQPAPPVVGGGGKRPEMDDDDEDSIEIIRGAANEDMDGAGSDDDGDDIFEGIEDFYEPPPQLARPALQGQLVPVRASQRQSAPPAKFKDYVRQK